MVGRIAVTHLKSAIDLIEAVLRGRPGEHADNIAPHALMIGLFFSKGSQPHLFLLHARDNGTAAQTVALKLNS